MNSKTTTESMQAASVIRYVVTHVNKDGMRTLVDKQQGQFTYATAALAQARLDAFTANNTPEQLAQYFGLPLEVRPVECWPGHFDPKSIWFD